MKINPAIFKEYDIRGRYPEEIDDKAAYCLGLAFAKMIKAKKIVVGRDNRPESERVFWPLVAGLVKGGKRVSDLGVCATPELFFAVGEKEFPGGVMVTASHSPQGQTGFKFCDDKGRVLGGDSGLKKVAKLADAQLAKLGTAAIGKPSRGVDFFSIAKDYKKFALSFTKPADVAGFSLILDASGGSGGRLAEVVFGALPLKFTPLNFRSGDDYPDHGLNPLLAENQKATAGQVKKAKADLGIIFDGDADRAIFINERGEFVQPYYINCLLAQIILVLKKNITIAVDARLNLGIAQTIKNNSGKILVQRSGYANFIRTMTQKKLLFGCENSGHFMYNFKFKKDQQFIYGDAIISVLLILRYLKKNKLKLSEAVKPFSDAYKISGEMNFQTGRFEQIAKEIKKEFPQAAFSAIDGLSATAPDKSWFFNIRPSHTEPVVRLNIEAINSPLIEKIRHRISALL